MKVDPIPCTAPRVALFLVLALATALLHGIPSQGNAAGGTIIILDGSGSMWGEVPGGVKIDVARETITDLVADLDPTMELGLMAYGHRKKGDCSDIELLVPPGPGTRDRILEAVRSLIPKGKTPLSDAVISAADHLRYEEERATVILVSDGIETCGKDPCAVGAQLAARGIDFVCHVIGFDLDDEEKKDLVCLAEKTGGLYLDAADAEQLRDSLNEALRAVVEPVTSLVLSARTAEGEPLDGVHFSLYRSAGTEDPVHRGTGGSYRREVDPGPWVVAARFGDRTARVEVEAIEGETTSAQLTFSASGLTARAVLTEGSTPIERGLGWRVFDGPATSPARKTLAYSYHAAPTFHLPAGTYFIRVTKEETTVEEEVVIEEGRASDITIVLGSGVLAARARRSEAESPIEGGLAWSLLSEPDSEGDRKQVAYSYEDTTHILAPAGSYLLTARYGNSYAESEVEIRAGETTEALLTFGAGTLVLDAVMTDGGEAASGKLAWKVFSPPDEEGKRKQVAYSYHDEPKFTLPSGDYEVELARGAASVTEGVAVRAGEPTRSTLNLNAGSWTGTAFLAESSPEPQAEGTFWRIFTLPDSDGKRKQIAYSYDPQPRFFLPAGPHTVSVECGAVTVERETFIAPGRLREDRIVLNGGLIHLHANDAGKPAWQVWSGTPEDKGDRLGYSTKEVFSLYLPEGPCVVELTVTDGAEKSVHTAALLIEAGETREVAVGP